MGVAVLVVLASASCALVAPFDPPESGSAYDDIRGPAVREDPRTGADGDADADPDDPPQPDDPPPDDRRTIEVEAICEPYCLNRDACDPDQGGPLCRATCRCAVTSLVRPDWAEPIGTCAAGAGCEMHEPLIECADSQAAAGGVTQAAQAAYDRCVARENELGCPGRFDCPLLRAVQDDIATSVAGCLDRATCDEIRTCGEGQLLSFCL